MSLYRTLREQTSKYSEKDPEWVQFIYDHLDWLEERSTEVEISPTSMFHRRYRPEAILGELGVPTRIVWIVMILNGITDPVQFHELKSVRIIDRVDPVETLYMSYITWHENLIASEARLAEQT